MNAIKKKLSICITAYNRPKELLRCLKSIKCNYPNDIEIIVSEDNSPKREEVRKTLNEFKSTSELDIRDNYNKINLGYDRNLNKLISLSKSEYVLFISDDDALNENMLDRLIELLRQKKELPYIFTSYTSKDNYATNRKYNKSFKIEPGEDSVKKFMYDAILFSGLVFKRNIIENYSADEFVNTNYFQIYLALNVLYKYGGYYYNIDLINCIGDGENGYGTTELSNNNPLLADRTSVYSDLEFNKGLVKVIRIFDEKNKTEIIKWFEREYSLRGYRGMSVARSESRSTLKKYWQMINNIGIKIRFPSNVYYVSLLILGSDICNIIYNIPRKILFYYRRRR